MQKKNNRGTTMVGTTLNQTLCFMDSSCNRLLLMRLGMYHGVEKV
jgi:hypothetical protein